MRTKKEEKFTWKIHNLESMINAVNESLDKLRVDKEKFRLRYAEKKLHLGNGVAIGGNINHLGNIVHTLVLFVDVWKTTEAKHLKQIIEDITRL